MMRDAYVEGRLRMLDLLLHREILRLRARYRLSQDEFHGLYISDQQVDALIGADSALRGQEGVDALTAQADRVRQESRQFLSAGSRWQLLCERFALNAAEEDIVLLACAPEVDTKYETVYAYLHNEVSRKLPSCGLAARVLANDEEGEQRVRRALLPGARLFARRLLTAEGGPGHHGLLAQTFRIAAGAAAFLLELEEPPKAVLRRWDEAMAPDEVAEMLSRLKPGDPVVVLEAEDEVSVKRAAQAVCYPQDLPLLTLDLARECGSECTRLTEALGSLLFRARLYGAAALVTGTEVLWGGDGQLLDNGRALATALEDWQGLAFLQFRPATNWRAALASVDVMHFVLPEPGIKERASLWQRALERRGATASADLVQEVAARFSLGAAGIESAATAAVDHRRITGPNSALTFAAVADGVRALSTQAMGRLANKVVARRCWNDLVLPQNTLTQLREIANASRHRHAVLEEWGMSASTGARPGIKALFSGPSGTGKTLSAEVLAQELELDLYQIDLSTVVSKYIGETEKNLDRIFRTAKGVNAILFFDEADALFGKRSEVKDAHDRYANIEVSYLLQKMEEFEGVAILATNLSQNMDPAFSRRLNYCVDFPMPDEAHRLRLWRAMFAPEAPLAESVDFEFLARQFRFSGGEIRNVALSAAFQAAGDGRVITMEFLVKATARHLIKQGRVPSSGDFKQYHAWIG